MKKKSILTLILVCVLTFCFSVTSFATQIFVDLVEVKTDVAPQIINDRTMVPLRAIAEMIGCRVEWVSDKRQVEIYSAASKTLSIVMQIGNKTAKCLNSEKTWVDYEMDSPPIIVNDRTLVPLRFVSETSGYTVDYNVDNQNVYLFSSTYMENQIGEGKGSDAGDGVGTAKPITNEEINYILSFKTQSWLDLNTVQKDKVLSLIAQWWELVDGYIVPDFAALKQDLDFQMEAYSKNKVDISLFKTACEIRGIDANKYINAKG